MTAAPRTTRIFDVEIYDGDRWVPNGQLAIIEDAITHNGTQVHTIDYQAPNHALVLTGKADDPTFRAKINLTESGTAFVGTMSVRDGMPQAIRGVELEVVYETRRRPASDPQAPMEPWDNLTIKSEWVDQQLKITYLLGREDISSRVRVTKVDRQKGETTLEMVAQFDPPFRQNAFVIVLTSGNHSFGGTYTDDDSRDYAWFGQIPGELAASRAAVFRGVQECRSSLKSAPAPTATMSFQELDNISSIQIVTAPDGKQITVDYAQTTCGSYFNKCLVNGLDSKWIDGIYGHPYSVPDGVQKVFNGNTKFFQDQSVLGTGQMLYDTLSTSPAYKDLIKRIEPSAMKNAWQNMGKAENVGLSYQKVSNDLYIQGYRDGVSQMKPYLEDDPERWAEGYYAWLTDTANLLTWQIQVASKEFDNVKTRMYEWYVKLQILAPDKDYGQKFLTIAYSALLGVNYSKSRWSDDIKPFLKALIENAIAGKIDPDIMDEVQRQAALENIELLKTRPNTLFHRVFDQIVHVDLAAEDRLGNIAFAATIDGSSVSSICALAPTNVSESTHTFRSALLRDASGETVGEIRFDARRLGRAAASQELASSGLWTDVTAVAYANALGGAMVWPVLSQLQALSPVPA